MAYIKKEEIDKIAVLARLKLKPEERELLATELESILGFVSTLAEADIEGVDYFLNAAEEGSVFREDEIIESLPRDKALQNSPKQKNGCFKIPPIQG
jgi:aspartyl-tRNA(Asn)/glutamyl-tRNA(Gln) amidotransferase subunit C